MLFVILQPLPLLQPQLLLKPQPPQIEGGVKEKLVTEEIEDWAEDWAEERGIWETKATTVRYYVI